MKRKKGKLRSIPVWASDQTAAGEGLHEKEKGKWRIGREGIRAWMQGDERYEERDKEREKEGRQMNK